MVRRIAWLLVLSMLLSALASCAGVLPGETESSSMQESGSTQESGSAQGSESAQGSDSTEESDSVQGSMAEEETSDGAEKETEPEMQSTIEESLGLPPENEPETAEHNGKQTAAPHPDDNGAETMPGDIGGGDHGLPTSGSCGKSAMWTYEDGVLTVSGTGTLERGDWHHLSNEVRRVVVGDGIVAIANFALADLHAVMEISLPASIDALGSFIFTHDGELSILRIADMTEAEWSKVSLERFTFDGIEQTLVILLSDATLTVTPSDHGGAGGDEHETESGKPQDPVNPEPPEDPDDFTQSGDEHETGTMPPEPPTQSEDETNPPAPEQSEEETISPVPEQSEEETTPPAPEQSEDETNPSAPEQSEEETNPPVPEQSEGEEETDFDDIGGSEEETHTPCGEQAYWWYSDEQKSLHIYGSGSITEASWGNAIANQVLGFSIAEGITGIDTSIYLPNATTVFLPASLTSVKQYAFSGASNLISLKIGRVDAKGSKTPYDIHYLFGDLSKLRKLTVLGGTEIGDRACEGLTELVEAVLPAGVTRIGEYAFSYCEQLTDINTQCVKVFGKNAFDSCKTLDCVSFEAAESIASYAFAYTALIEIAFGDALESIGENAFCDIGTLLSVTFGDGVRTVGDYAFFCCDMLAALSLNEGLTTIGRYAFEGCDDLTEVTLPATLRVLGYEAFDAWGIKRVTLSLPLQDENGNVVTLESAFNESVVTEVVLREGTERVSKAFFQWCSVLTTVRLPASLTVIEASAFKGCYNLQTLTRAGYALTEIGDNAFYDCDLITEFHFDATLKKIGEDAFFSTALTECMLPEGLQTVGSGAFNDCTQMTNVYIPTTVTAIGSSAFPGNIVTLTAPILPDTVMAASDRYVLFSMLKTVTVIGTASEVPAGYFEGYYDLETVTLPSSVTAIGDDAFSYCENLTAVIGGSIKTVGKSAFSYCKSYTVLALGSQLESIGDSAFEGTAIVQISFPDSLTSIGKSAFESVHSLTSVTFGRGMRTVGNYAFSGCEELRTLSLNEGLTHIGVGAFEYTALTELTLPSSLQVLGTSAFYDTEIERLTLSLPLVDEKGRSIYMENVLSPETLLYATVREGCTTLPKNFFTYCSSLVEVTLPSSLRVIDDYAFFECESLERLNFTPTSLTDIGDSAFYYCTSLTEFPFAAPLKVIDNDAFASASLERVILPQGLQRIGDCAFDDCAMSELYVPTSVTAFNGTDGCSNLTKVSMPITLVDRYFEYVFDGSSVEHLVILGNPSEITDAYFCNASSLITVTVPVSVTYIGVDAFSHMTALKTVYYEGTEAQWNSITFGENAFYGTPDFTLETK